MKFCLYTKKTDYKVNIAFYFELIISNSCTIKKRYVWHSEIQIFYQSGRKKNKKINKTHVPDLIGIDEISSYISLSLGTLSHLLTHDQFSKHISLFIHLSLKSS